MREYVVLTINDKTLTFEYKSIESELLKYVNTNEMYQNALYYDLKQYKKHTEEILDKFKCYNLETLVIKEIVIFKYISQILNYLLISNFRMDIPSTLSIEDYDEILTSYSIKKIDCYYMPSFIKKKFDERNIQIVTYNKYKINEDFLLAQDVFDYETLYYKKDITINNVYPQILNDIKEFLRINYNLKCIHIKYYSKELINGIIELLNNDESKDVVVFLYQSQDDKGFIKDNFEWLKSINEKCKEENICEFRILYSDSFLKNNLFKQLTFNNLKLISILGVYVCVISLLIFKSYSYVEKLNVEKLNNELINDNTLVDSSTEGLDVGETEEDTDKYSFDNVFSKLKKINNETVGYLVVNNTSINYPVVKHSDNSYYLKKDFYKKSTSMGWLFMDYRNNPKEMNDNTIIYGHSMKNGTMFGTLKKTLNTSWRKQDENMIIHFSNELGDMQFKIFSVYKVDYTTDYLKNEFNSKDSFNEFVKLIKGRSVFKSKEEVSYGDKILTLSTCIGTENKRLVVHAVLMEE